MSEYEKRYPKCVGKKIRSKGMGRGLGIGKGKGPIHERAERNVEKALGLKREPEVGIFEEVSTEELKKIMRDN